MSGYVSKMETKKEPERPQAIRPYRILEEYTSIAFRKKKQQNNRGKLDLACLVLDNNYEAVKIIIIIRGYRFYVDFEVLFVLINNI